MLELSKNADFRTIVDDEVALQFDGDDNALLKTIRVQTETELGIDLAEEFGQSIQNHAPNDIPEDAVSIEESIEGFGFRNGLAYLQIYIPFFDSVNRAQDPIICVNYGDDGEGSLETLVGYKLDKNGELEEFIVTEQMAASQLVWVVGANERPNVDDPCDPITFGYTGTSNTTDLSLCTTANPCFKVKLENVWFQDKDAFKESWFNGKADIAFTAHFYKLGCNPALEEYIPDVSGNQIIPSYQYKRKHVGQTKIVDKPIMKKTHFFAANQDEILAIVFYELDNSAKIKPITYRTCGANADMGYLSRNGAYGLTWVDYNSFDLTDPNFVFTANFGNKKFGLKAVIQ